MKLTRRMFFAPALALPLLLAAIFAVPVETQTRQQQRGPQPGRAPQQQRPATGATNVGVTQTRESQAAMTPARALQLLRDGNGRFVEGELINRDLRAQVRSTAEGQYPFAVILSCMDSRTSSDLLFDLNKGDAFSIRIAGNVVNEDILGGMEFGTKAAGAKLIAVVGHTRCGAIYGACDNVQLGNLTGLLERIKPAVNAVPASVQPRTSKNPRFVETVTEENVRLAMRQVRERSQIIRELVDSGKVGIVGGVYDISDGRVRFFEN